MNKVNKTKEEWKQELDEETFRITRDKGTEAPGTGKYYQHDEEGQYICSNCKTTLFSSDAKFESGSGWPSFDGPIEEENIKIISDESHGLVRTEVVCAVCNAHLGHVFEDGPKDTTGKRYCINSGSLDFKNQNT